MKKLYMLMMLMIPLISMAQNGGQANDNTVLHIDMVSYINNAYGVAVTNKLPCDAAITIRWLTKDTTVTVGPSITKTVQLPGAFETGKVRASSNAVCNQTPGIGQVEVQVLATLLPLKYKDFNVKRVGNTITVSIVPLETTSVKQLNIQVSFDGLSYRTLQVVNKDQLVLGQLFTKTITVKK